MGKCLVVVQDVGLTRLQVTCKISFQFLVLQSVPPEGLPGKASTSVAGPPARHGGTSVSPTFWGGFPPLHLAVSPVVKQWRWLRAGPCVSRGGPAPPQPLQLAWGRQPGGSRSKPLPAPLRVRTPARCVLFGEERCAPLLGRRSLRLPAAPGSGMVAAVPVMTWAFILNPQLLASRECGRIPFLFFFSSSPL